MAVDKLAVGSYIISLNFCRFTKCIKCSSCSARENLTKKLINIAAQQVKSEFPQVQPFLQHLYVIKRKFNSTFQMINFGCNGWLQPILSDTGQVYNLISSTVSIEGESPKFAQMCFISDRDSEIATIGLQQ